jgi:hypothetical protein
MHTVRDSSDYQPEYVSKAEQLTKKLIDCQTTIEEAYERASKSRYPLAQDEKQAITFTEDCTNLFAEVVGQFVKSSSHGNLWPASGLVRVLHPDVLTGRGMVYGSEAWRTAKAAYDSWRRDYEHERTAARALWLAYRSLKRLVFGEVSCKLSSSLGVAHI